MSLLFLKSYFLYFLIIFFIKILFIFYLFTFIIFTFKVVNNLLIKKLNLNLYLIKAKFFVNLNFHLKNCFSNKFLIIFYIDLWFFFIVNSLIFLNLSFWFLLFNNDFYSFLFSFIYVYLFFLFLFFIIIFKLFAYYFYLNCFYKVSFIFFYFLILPIYFLLFFLYLNFLFIYEYFIFKLLLFLYLYLFYLIFVNLLFFYFKKFILFIKTKLFFNINSNIRNKAVYYVPAWEWFFTIPLTQILFVILLWAVMGYTWHNPFFTLRDSWMFFDRYFFHWLFRYPVPVPHYMFEHDLEPFVSKYLPGCETLEEAEDNVRNRIGIIFVSSLIVFAVIFYTCMAYTNLWGSPSN